MIDNWGSSFVISFIRVRNKSTGKMKEGTVPIPSYHRPAERDDDVLPVQVVLHLGGGRSGGGETPESVQVF